MAARDPVNVLNIQRITPSEADMIRAVDARVELVDAGGWFDGEIRETWPAFSVERYLGPDAMGVGDRAERDRMLAAAEVVLGGWPYPLDLRQRAPRLKWLHQRPAGASNLLMGDLWGSDLVVTTSRGLGNTLAIAEYAMAGLLHFAKGLPQAARDRDAGRFQHRAYRPLLLDGKTMCVVGAGGIGQDVGRLAAALGMRVVGTRSRPVATADLPEGFSAIGGPDDLEAMLAEADAVAICCQWTPETTRLFDARRLALLKPECMLVNVARGEIVDEAALVDALKADRLRGVVLDVYEGEFERPPVPALWSHPRVMVTPHISGGTDDNRHRSVELFCDNLKAYLDGRPLQNVIDWDRGY